MKHIVLAVLAIVTMFNVAPLYAQSSSSLPISSTFAMPGVNCGNAQSTDPAIQKCCYNQPFNQNQQVQPDFYFPIISSIPIVGTLLKTAVDALSGIVTSQFQRMLPSASQLQRQVVLNPCVDGDPSTPGDPGNPSCMCKPAKDSPLLALESLCQTINTKEKQLCIDCVKGTNTSGLNKNNRVGVWTGLGCVRANASGFITETLLGWGIGLAGFITLLCVIYSAFTLQTSQGNPEKIKKAQENLTSCIMGLLLIMFSVLILRLIGVDILRIPGFG